MDNPRECNTVTLNHKQKKQYIHIQKNGVSQPKEALCGSPHPVHYPGTQQVCTQRKSDPTVQENKNPLTSPSIPASPFMDDGAATFERARVYNKWNNS